MVSYTCQHELLPVVEAALAANGYTIETPLSRRIHGSSLTIMTRGDGGVLITHNAANELAEIDVWGAAQTAASRLLESLPLPLERQPSVTHAYHAASRL